MSPEAIELLMSLATALGAGLLVGVERGRDEEGSGQERFAGVRTFPLISLVGAIASLLGGWMLVATTVAMGLLIAAGYLRESARANVGMSTEVAALVTFSLGALSTAPSLGFQLSERLLLVAALATVTLGLLAIKPTLHALVARVSRKDLYATTKLLVLAVVLLPVLPDENMGPLGALNPRAIGYLVLLIASVSFAGYVAIRVRGARQGLVLTGVLGGLASSTAVTLAMAERTRDDDKLARAASVAVLLACAIMFPRVLVEIYVVSPTLAVAASPAFLVAGLVAGAAGAASYRQLSHQSRGGEMQVEVQNPLALSRTFWSAALLVAMLLSSAVAMRYFEVPGVYLAALVTGLADASAVGLSVARMVEQDALSVEAGTHAAAIAAGANTMAKIALAVLVSRRRLGRELALPLLVALLVGALVMLLS